jgi:PqqD family protein of HPr-rel-A system
MRQRSDNPRADETWCIDHPEALCWRIWDDGVVVYDDRNGDTHHFDVVTAAVFSVLMGRPATTRELEGELAALLQVKQDAELAAMIRSVLGLLQERQVVSAPLAPADATRRA